MFSHKYIDLFLLQAEKENPTPKDPAQEDQKEEENIEIQSSDKRKIEEDDGEINKKPKLVIDPSGKVKNKFKSTLSSFKFDGGK